MGAMMKSKTSVRSIEQALRQARASSPYSIKKATHISLIPSLSAPLDQHELQKSLESAFDSMALLDADGLQADTLLYAEDRFYSLYENAVKEANGAHFFLLLSPMTLQKNAVVGTSHQTIASHDLLLSQLYAALRASASGKITLLFPYAGTLQEINALRRLIAQAMKKLTAKGIPFDETISLGIVLGTPASLLLSRKLIEAVDLVMIDIDLLAKLSLNLTPVSEDFDRMLGENADAILRLTEIGIGNAHILGRFVMLSGNLATDPRFLPHFIAMGANALVLPPQKLKSAKALLRGLK